jgi:hypothetical protein
MRTLLLSFIWLVAISSPCYAEKIENSSPILWKIIIQKESGTKMVKGSEINDLLSTGISNKNIDVDCKLRFAREKYKAGRESIQDERIWIDCILRGIAITIDEVSCSTGRMSRGLGTTDSQSIYFNLKFGFKVFCGPTLTL